SLGKIPLIAEVQAEWPDGSTSPAEDVPVLFQLIAPDDPVGTAFVAPPLPDKVMNYDTDGVWWQIDSFPIQNQFNGGLDESEWKGLWTLVHKAWDATNDDVLAKAQAQTWITTWTTGGYDVDVPWAAVQDWWDGIAVTPYPRLIQGPDLVISKLGKIFDKIPDLANPPAVMPSKMAVGLAPLEVAEWEAVWKLVLKAMANTVALVPAHPSPVDHAKQQCIAWLRTWGAVNSLSWPRVSAWWTAQADTPYPRVRAKTAQKNLLGRVDFLLQQRAAASTRLAEITGAQRKYVTDLYTGWAGRAAPTDPQKDNVWHERGGKLGHADGIKAVLGQPAAPIDGFHTKRADAKKDFGTLALATMPADTGRNPHASECKTNDKGFAGVLMDPSRCGGDRYKLRAYIDPDWLLRESNGPVHEPEAKCGTLVVWRNLRLYRYYQMPNPWAAGTAPSPWLSTILEKGKYPPGHHEFQMMGLNSPMIDLAVFPGLATEARVYQPLNPGDLLKINERGEQLMYRPLAVSPTPFTTQFAWGYCEWIADAPSKSVLGNQERLDAMEFARNALERWWSAQGYQDVHWDTLFGFPKVTPRVDATSPFLFNMRVFSHYNELIANDPALAGVYAPFDLVANDDKQKMTVGLQFFVEAMMEYLCGGGSLPGFTIVQIPRGDNTEARAGYMTGTSTITSGYGTGSRGFYISHTESVYHGVFRIYPNTGNALHEFGHVLGLAHQMPAGASLVDAHQRAVNDPWQKPTADQCVCVMSYSGCYGDLCGECLLSLRGCSQPQTDRQIKDMYGLP
ncbi:MAG TPA: hypothetical protein DEH78_26235, partial [Solibacterales bacterium]|nr:hypothetical protein [Bryobacterales bacterium]